ncbi:MAG: YihY family inner membrane protein [Epsilonproteobacteria bacterium]|nr:YihY family inner membrane protein [Campylobacterota bacterium]
MITKRKALKLLSHTKFFISVFMDRELTLFAASLSFYTIFSFIPLLLILTMIATSLDSFVDIYAKIQEFVFTNLLPSNSKIIIEHLNSFLQNSVSIGKMSSIMLFVSSVFFFKNYEFIANRAFHAPKRKFLNSLGIYFLLILITPSALSLAFYITSYIAVLMASNSLTSGINILPLVPYLIIWILFFILFQLSPNVKVGFRASLISSFIISAIFSIAKNSFIYYIVLNQSYTTIYGSFATLLFLFLWIYASWIIFIYGLKLCYILNRVKFLK